MILVFPLQLSFPLQVIVTSVASLPSMIVLPPHALGPLQRMMQKSPLRQVSVLSLHWSSPSQFSVHVVSVMDDEQEQFSFLTQSMVSAYKERIMSRSTARTTAMTILYLL